MCHLKNKGELFFDDLNFKSTRKNPNRVYTNLFISYRQR